MNKAFIILATMLLAVGMSAYAFAADNEADPGASITVDDGATTPNELTFNFSPSVAGQYLTPTTSGTEQAYTIGTYHVGGTLFYGTDSSQTIVWKKDRTDTTQKFADAGFPGEVAAADDTIVPWNEAGSGWEK